MSKQFVKGNIYVFSKKAFLKEEGRKDWKQNKKWVNIANGRIVKIWDESNGSILRCLCVIPQWCKCIKNNVGSKK